MNKLTIGRSTYNKWIKILYNNENLNPRVYLIPEEFPPKRISAFYPASVPIKRTEIYFERTGTGWRCSHELTIVNNIPCPLIPDLYKYDIEEGRATIEELTQFELRPRQRITAQTVTYAALGELGRRRSSN